MVKKILVLLFFLAIGILLQKLMIDTAPRIPCDQTDAQLLKMLRSLFGEFFSLIFMLFAVNRLWLKLTRSEHLWSIGVFSATYLGVFFVFFNAYAYRCEQTALLF